ncbi:hypothetical protein GH714_033118 [Hevea brasiliensis]|uniref:Uncharacterized protein n=1 Tax=Hevea brasiliensis TaxID=3981 RepID=A0A6A6LVL5_HEVBR|nr:hypothetical protein GH714_033118 [Hevea brasiliensis]
MPNSAYVLIPSDNSYSNDPEVVTGTSKRANGMSKGILPEVGIQEANLAVGGENEKYDVLNGYMFHHVQEDFRVYDPIV